MYHGRILKPLMMAPFAEGQRNSKSLTVNNRLKIPHTKQSKVPHRKKIHSKSLTVNNPLKVPHSKQSTVQTQNKHRQNRDTMTKRIRYAILEKYLGLLW